MVKNFKEIVGEYWPQAKVELEKGLVTAKKLLAEGEKHLKDFTEKSAKNARKLSLSVLKEKLYYDLGKLTAGLARDKWVKNPKISGLIQKIKKLAAEIKKIK